MKGKALVSSLLAFVLTVSMVTPALAAGNATDVTLTVETDETPSTVSVKVPAVIPLHMDKQGVVSVEGDLKIENLSQESGVSVTGITVSGKSGWQVVDYSYDASAEPLNTEKIGMLFNGDPTTAGGSVTLTDGSWDISAQGQLSLVVDAKVPKRDSAPEQSSIAAVNWSFKVEDGGVVTPDESSAISNDWDAGSKMLTGGVRPVTFSWDSTAEDVSVVSVSAADDSVVSVAASMAEMPYNGSATYNVTAKAKGATKVTATLSTGETSEFTVEVCEVKTEGGGDITINVPGTGLKPGDKPGDITIDIPVTGPDGDTTITVKPEIPGDTTLNPGDNEIEVDVTVDGVTIHITIIIKVESDNPSDGLSQSVEEAQAMGFTFSPYEGGLQIDSFENKQFKSEINVPEQIGDFKVLKIGDGVFQGQSNLTKVTLPNTVTVVGAGAFKNCGKLNSFIIPDSCTDIGDEAFYNCVAIASVSLPSGTSKIGDSVFYGCAGLTSVNIPDTVISIGDSAFRGCENLGSLTLSKNLAGIGDKAFYGAFSGSATLTVECNIPGKSSSAAIFDHANLGSVVIGESVTAIGGNAFYNCKIAGNVVLPANVESIGSGAFYGAGLAEGNPELFVNCNMGDGREFKDAFKGSKFVKVHIAEGATKISDNSFYGCAYMQAIDLPESLTYIGGSAFYGCKELTRVTIPNGVTSLGASAFAGCAALESVTIPDSVKYVKDRTFSGCSALKSITIPGSVTSIGAYAFRDCESLVDLTIPATVTSLGARIVDGSGDGTGTITVNCNTAVTSNNDSILENSRFDTLIFGEGVSSIKNCFAQGSYIPNVVLPSTLKEIGQLAFATSQSGISNIDVPSSVTTIGFRAFGDVQHINYSGSASGSPWGALAIN